MYFELKEMESITHIDSDLATAVANDTMIRQFPLCYQHKNMKSRNQSKSGELLQDVLKHGGNPARHESGVGGAPEQRQVEHDPLLDVGRLQSYF